MAIIEFTHSHFNENWWSLVSCEHPEHIGCRERLIRRCQAKKSQGVMFCKICAYKSRSEKGISEKHRKSLSEAGKRYYSTHPAIGIVTQSQGKKNFCYGKNGRDHPAHHSNRTSESIKKQSDSHKGEKSWNWNPELTPEERSRHGYRANNRTWRQDVFERDNFICCITGKRGGDMQAHHLYSYRDNPDLRHNLSNGVTISDEYHKLFHRLYGYGQNTPQQFEEFIQNLLNPYPPRAIV